LKLSENGLKRRNRKKENFLFAGTLENRKLYKTKKRTGDAPHFEA